MYLRPGNLLRDFVVERQTIDTSDMGRPQRYFLPTGNILTGVLAEASQDERFMWKQRQHPITHKIVQNGSRQVADIGDRLSLGTRIFYVRGRDDISALGISTIFYVEERTDYSDTRARSGLYPSGD